MAAEHPTVTTCSALVKSEKCQRSSSALNETVYGPRGLSLGSPVPDVSPRGSGLGYQGSMAKVNSGSSGCRAMVMAGKYLTSPSPPVLTRSSGQRQRRMFSPHGRMVSSDAAGTGGKTAALAQQEHLGYFSAADRHVLANRNLIYRDVKAFLNEVGGDPREARYWLTQFQRATSIQSPAFAVLEVVTWRYIENCLKVLSRIKPHEF